VTPSPIRSEYSAIDNFNNGIISRII
jgi:hypothetical protein